jgi:hypothetical protein
MWMDLLERKVPEHKAQTVRELALQLMHRMTRHSSVGALVIAVLDQRYGGVRFTLDMIVTRYGVCQSHELFPKSVRVTIESLRWRTTVAASRSLKGSLLSDKSECRGVRAFERR